MFDITSTTEATSVIPFTGKEAAPSGYRVIGIHYKERKATSDKPAVAKKPSVALCAPCIIIQSIEPASLQSACQEAINELQDALARQLVEQGKTSIPFADLAATAIAAFAAEQATSKRLNKDGIVSWFDSSVQPALMAALTAALELGTDATDLDMTKLIQAVGVYRSRFAELAAPKPAISVSDAEKLLKWANKSTDLESTVAASVVSKLNLLTKRTEVELLI